MTSSRNGVQRCQYCFVYKLQITERLGSLNMDSHLVRMNAFKIWSALGNNGIKYKRNVVKNLLTDVFRNNAWIHDTILNFKISASRLLIENNKEKAY